MKKKLLFLSFSLFSCFVLNAQTDKLWKEISNKEGMVKHKSVTRESFPLEFKLFQLNLESMKQVLYSAPDRRDVGATGVVISVPNSDGKLERFEMFEASNFDAELQAQYPNIRAYAGKGLDDKTAQIRLSFGVNSLQTMVFRADKATEFMEPYTQDATVFAVYSRSNVTKRAPFTCLTVEEQQIANLGRNGNQVLASNPNLRTFRLALSCVGEYSNYFGATSSAQSALVLTAFNNTMTRVNGVNNRDFAIHMNIVAATTNVIYYNPATDPYSDAATGSAGAWNAELQNTLSSSLTGPATSLATNNAAYDIGHLFGASGGGGNAGCIGCVCVNDTASTTDKNKGSAFTSPGDNIPSGDTFDIDYVAHEMGHQLGANHTFSHSTEDNAVNYEPGSGSTIMAYAGITSKDVQNNSDDYFHAGSIDQVQTNMAGKTCDVETTLTHGVPVVAAGADFTIPKSTPFTLTGSATDSGGGALTYCWEQYDDASGAGNLCSISTVSAGDNDCVPVGTKTAGPVFRSYQPTTSSSRTFPRLQSVLTGSTTTTGSEIVVEALPSVARTLNFRLTARDNSVVGGAGLTNFDDVIVTVANKDPLTVSYPANANTDVYAIASTHTVTWTGTASATTGHQTIAGATNVDILFSNDGGLTFPYTLLSGTPNDGSQSVTLPAGVSGADCRFKVKASSNIFFNISKSFAVGNYTYQPQNSCTDYVLNFGGLDIPEDSGQFVGYGVSVPDAFTLTDSNIRVELTHPDIGSVFLAVRPAHVATGVTQFFNGSCDGSANMNLNFDTSGSVLNCAAPTSGVNTIPPVASSVTAINAFNGNSATGTWYIFFTDIAVGDGNIGTIEKVTFNLCKSVNVAVLASESFGLDNFVIYPNPNSGNFNVQFSSNSNNEIKIVVHDMRGREIFTNNYNNSGLFNESIQLNNVQSGIYLVTVQDGDRKEVKKIIIE